MIEMPKALADLLAERRRQFAFALPERAAEVESRWRSMGPAPWDPDDLRAVETAAHGLAGTAALLGFDRFGATARAVEHALQELRASGAFPAPDRVAAVDSALRGMSSALAPDP